MRYGSFWEFYEDALPRMLARAVLTCLHRQDAEDAVADAYLKALQHWERIGGYPQRAAEKWVHTTLQRDLWKTLRGRKKNELLAMEVPVPPQSSVEETVEARRVLGVVAQLPPRQRVALVAHCLEGLSQDDVARELGVKRGAVAAHIYQARRTLERLLGLTPPQSPQPGPRERLTWLERRDLPAEAAGLEPTWTPAIELVTGGPAPAGGVPPKLIVSVRYAMFPLPDRPTALPVQEWMKAAAAFQATGLANQLVRAVRRVRVRFGVSLPKSTLAATLYLLERAPRPSYYWRPSYPPYRIPSMYPIPRLTVRTIVPEGR